MKPEIKVLKFMLQSAQHAQRAKDPRERLAATKLEIEFAERIAQLEREESEPELALAHDERKAS